MIITVSLLAKIFIRERGEFSSQRVRSAYGKLCGICGIILNLLLFAAKAAVGLISGSLAITADAFNNLSDAGSSVITLAGFRLAEKKPDPEHPFGHGRIEYISGLIVSMVIILMGTELTKTSFSKIIEPALPGFSVVTVIVLLLSIFTKVYIYLYNKKFGKLIDSQAMLATAKDSLSDTVSTAAVLFASAVTHFTSFVYLDAICGLAVSAFIIVTGVRSAIETVSPLLGSRPSPEFIARIRELASSDKRILGLHDIVVHDYGPGRVMVSLHCEVASNEDIMSLHELIDGIEMKISEELNCETVIHTDPIDTEDETLAIVRGHLQESVKKLHTDAKFHDLRIVRGDNRLNVIFDLILPFGVRCSASDAKEILTHEMKKHSPEYECILKLDTDYTGA
ncbi:MAG: cation transporter [Ruminococcaceae bacterium]|nr:cation transporter [Oscillospiraceae bacterium]